VADQHAHDAFHFIDAKRKADGRRARFGNGESIRLIHEQFGGICDQPIRWKDGLQFR
jgi:hypothetical protein